MNKTYVKFQEVFFSDAQHLGLVELPERFVKRPDEANISLFLDQYPKQTIGKLIPDSIRIINMAPKAAAAVRCPACPFPDVPALREMRWPS